MTQPKNLTSRVVEAFLTGNLSPLLIVISLVAGVAAVLVTPREEEPQIVVPLADVFVEVPGASAEEVERLVATRVERLLYQIDGVEYVYSMSLEHRAVVTVRFYVGEDRERSLVKLHNKLLSSSDQVPPQVSAWVVKPVEIDDAPILAATLYSDRLDDHALRRVAEEVESRIQEVPDVGRTRVLGGRPRKVRVQLRPRELQARGVGIDQLTAALAAAAVQLPAGSFASGNQVLTVEAGQALLSARELEQLVVAVHDGRPVYLRDLAEVLDGPDEPTSHVRLSFGPAAASLAAPFDDRSRDWPAVTLAVAKKKGTNAVWVAASVREKLDFLQREVLPAGVMLRITRDHGETADHKVDELMEGLAVAIVTVILLISVMLGWREGLIVASAVPITFALTLLVNLLLGYSINRVTLFALTLALGLVVDDPIVDVENIFRHLRMRDGRSAHRKVLDAVAEVRPPIIVATLAVIVSFLPLFGITGMMGPYMAPMALGVPVAMLMSLLVAFTVTPWLAYKVLRGHASTGADAEPTPVSEGSGYRLYGAVLRPLLASPALRWWLIGGTLALFAASLWLGAMRLVPLKLLPYDNKNELQIVLDLPEGTPLERTEGAAAEMAALLRGLPEVADVCSYAGVPSPMDFNGMVRHYYLREQPHLAELRINLIPKGAREHHSHAIALRVRELLAGVAARYDAAMSVVELPPGPPVIATLTAEIRGEPHLPYARLCEAAQSVAARLRQEGGVVDVDSTVESTAPRLTYVLDREKAALSGVDPAIAARVLESAIAGKVVAHFGIARELSPLEVELRLPRAARSSIEELHSLPVTGSGGQVLALGEIGTFVEAKREQTRYRKNLQPVVYVFAEVAGRAPAEAILDIQADLIAAGRAAGADRRRSVEDRSYLSPGGGQSWQLPAGTNVTWSGEGEWKITLDVFRDLGIAFLVACFGIFVLLVHETRSYVMPLILMTSIPLTVIGIFPGFWLLNLLSSETIAGAPNPVFFTATAMIGMIALAGIAVRNGILLLEFVHTAESDGRPLQEALIESGAVRFRPIFLTAGTALLAAVPITLDPIFSGLAWALIFGLVVSTAFTLVLVPTLYFMVYGRAVRERNPE